MTSSSPFSHYLDLLVLIILLLLHGTIPLELPNLFFKFVRQRVLNYLFPIFSKFMELQSYPPERYTLRYSFNMHLYSSLSLNEFAFIFNKAGSIACVMIQCFIILCISNKMFWLFGKSQQVTSFLHILESFSKARGLENLCLTLLPL